MITIRPISSYRHAAAPQAEQKASVHPPRSLPHQTSSRHRRLNPLKNHRSKCTERLRFLCLRACGARHPGVRPGGGQPPHTSGHRTRHPVQFWVVRTYKISSHRSVFSKFILNLLIVGRSHGSVPPSPPGDVPERMHSSDLWRIGSEQKNPNLFFAEGGG